jgi:hypothetical protein
MWGASRCSICREVLNEGQAVVATTHFIADPNDLLWRFSDSGMHAACFAAWEHRDEFAARYHSVMGITLAGFVPAVRANPDAPPLPKSRLMVLGTQEEREGYLADLQRHGSPNTK